MFNDVQCYVAPDSTESVLSGSTVKVKNLDPTWDETFDLPVAKPEHASLEAMAWTSSLFKIYLICSNII